MKVVFYEEQENDYKIGIKEANFIVYGMIGKEIVYGLSKKKIVQKMYEQIKPSIDYELRRMSEGKQPSTIDDTLDGEDFFPDAPYPKTVAITCERFFDMPAKGQLNIELNADIKDQYGNMIDRDIMWSVSRYIDGVSLNNNILCINKILSNDDVVFDIIAICGQAIDKKTITLFAHEFIENESVNDDIADIYDAIINLDMRILSLESGGKK